MEPGKRDYASRTQDITTDYLTGILNDHILYPIRANNEMIREKLEWQQLYSP